MKKKHFIKFTKLVAKWFHLINAIDDNHEIENYRDKGAPFGGAEGQHTRGMEKRGTINPNRAGAQSSGGPRF